MYVVQTLPPEDNTTASVAFDAVEALIANLSKFKTVPCHMDTASPFQSHCLFINN